VEWPIATHLFVCFSDFSGAYQLLQAICANPYILSYSISILWPKLYIIKEESPVLEAGGNRSTRGKPARASMDWKPNAHEAWELPGLETGPQRCKARTEPLR